MQGENHISHEQLYDSQTIETLNDLIMSSVDRGQLGSENANRLSGYPSILGSETLSSLENITPDDRPPAQGLRNIDDFNSGEEAYIKTTEVQGHLNGSIASKMPGLVAVQGASFMYLIEPTYAGLFTKREFDYYMDKRLGTGNGFSAIKINAELTLLLAKLGIGSEPDDRLTSRIKRMFRVSTHMHQKNASYNTQK